MKRKRIASQASYWAVKRESRMESDKWITFPSVEGLYNEHMCLQAGEDLIGHAIGVEENLHLLFSCDGHGESGCESPLFGKKSVQYLLEEVGSNLDQLESMLREDCLDDIKNELKKVVQRLQFRLKKEDELRARVGGACLTFVLVIRHENAWKYAVTTIGDTEAALLEWNDEKASFRRINPYKTDCETQLLEKVKTGFLTEKDLSKVKDDSGYAPFDPVGLNLSNIALIRKASSPPQILESTFLVEFDSELGIGDLPKVLNAGFGAITDVENTNALKEDEKICKLMHPSNENKRMVFIELCDINEKEGSVVDVTGKKMPFKWCRDLYKLMEGYGLRYYGELQFASSLGDFTVANKQEVWDVYIGKSMVPQITLLFGSDGAFDLMSERAIRAAIKHMTVPPSAISLFNDTCRESFYRYGFGINKEGSISSAVDDTTLGVCTLMEKVPDERPLLDEAGKALSV